MWVIVAASIAYTLSLYLYIRKKTKITFSFDKKIWLTIIQKMWPITIAIIFNVVYLRGDILILSFFKEQSLVGIYGAAYRVIDIVVQTAMMVMGVILPLLANSWIQEKKEEFQERYQMSFDAMMIIALPMFTGLFLLSHQIMTFIAGPNYYLSGDALRILSLAVLGVFLGGVFGHLAVAINKQKKVLWVYISNAIITLIGYLIFIPKYGMYGAAWMTVFSEFYTAIMLFFTIKKNLYKPLKLKLFGKIILANITMAVFIIFAKLPVLITIILSGLIYLITLILSRAISKDNLKDILTLKN
jgi:O-antigen/teichoic acid export membrane protein